MNTSDDDRDEMTEAYRQASSRDASRPSAATRNAILAEAAAAARRRTPAANDSRYLWRGAAAVAVLGVAVLLWRQIDPRMPGEAPLVAQVSEAAKAEAQSGASASAPPDLARAEQPMAEFRAAPQPAPPAAPAVGNAAADVAGLMRAEETAASPAMSKQLPAASDSDEADALLRLYFADQYQSNSPHSVWLVRNANGDVLRSGELAAGQTFAEVRSEVEAEVPGRLLRPWRIHSLRNAQGQPVEFGIAQTP